MNAEERIIASSPFFDAAFYKYTYGIHGNPASHYLNKGWQRGLNPSRDFSTEDYFLLNPDVKTADINPLLHYELFGKQEGRPYCYDDALLDPMVPFSKDTAHGIWPEFLKELCDKEGMDVLEIGSRVVTGADFGNLFEKASYTGFDLYAGKNVDVVGDVHKLSTYFDKTFDLIYSSAVFEHLAMPWIAANEIVKLLKPGGYLFIETHYCYGSHERPWHFFQFSEQALKVLFPASHGIECLEAGVSNPLVARFSKNAFIHLQNKYIQGMYCHSEFLGRKIQEVEDLSFRPDDLEELVGHSTYPEPHAL